MGLSTQSYSGRWFAPAKGYKAKPAKRKDKWGDIWRKAGLSFWVLSPGSHTGQDMLNFSSKKCYDNSTCEMLPTKGVRCPGILLGLGSLGTLCVACTKTLESQEESRRLSSMEPIILLTQCGGFLITISWYVSCISLRDSSLRKADFIESLPIPNPQWLILA